MGRSPTPSTRPLPPMSAWRGSLSAAAGLLACSSTYMRWTGSAPACGYRPCPRARRCPGCSRRREVGDAEARDVAAERLQPLEAPPRAHEPVHAPPRDAVAFLDDRSHCLGIEKAERTLERRAELVARLQHVDRVDFHERLEPLRERRLAAPDRSEI